MNDEFDQSTYLSQVRKLRSLAVDALREFSIEKYDLKFINHGENTTFKVITRKKSFLLRIHCRSHRTKSAFLEELKWLDSLSRKTKVKVQKPMLSKDGSFIVYVGNKKVGHSRFCDLLEWQDGYIKKKKNPKTFFEVGKLIGELHKNTIKSKHRLYWNTEGLIGKNATLGGVPALYKDFPRHKTKLEALRGLLYKKVKHYEKRNSDKLSLIHADLHFGNMIWNKGVVQPIDFDDCGYGLELYDLAVTLAQSSNYFKKVGKKQSSLCKKALLDGYEKYKNLTNEDIEILPYLVATRGLAMLGWLNERSDNPELGKYLKKNISTRIQQAEKYIDQAHLKTYFGNNILD
jgi:Ser/Thr protein kinase RdoA (MazF antagonist)